MVVSRDRFLDCTWLRVAITVVVTVAMVDGTCVAVRSIRRNLARSNPTLCHASIWILDTITSPLLLTSLGAADLVTRMVRVTVALAAHTVSLAQERGPKL